MDEAARDVRIASLRQADSDFMFAVIQCEQMLA
jgi:hypothetical protein